MKKILTKKEKFDTDPFEGTLADRLEDIGNTSKNCSTNSYKKHCKCPKAGYYRANSKGKSKCFKCPAGTYNNRYNHKLGKEDACKRCPFDRISGPSFTDFSAIGGGLVTVGHPGTHGKPGADKCWKCADNQRTAQKCSGVGKETCDPPYCALKTQLPWGSFWAVGRGPTCRFDRRWGWGVTRDPKTGKEYCTEK